ncbi:MAG: mevalonate kinase family protein [Rhodanobacter sp.]
MQVMATAPGKLVITGEYAVLEGAPALVLAIDRVARVTLQNASNAAYQISAPGLGLDAVCGQLDASGRMSWPALSAPTIKQLTLVSAVLETLAEDAVPAPFHATLDTSAFYSADARTKLGLGSSAALTVALANAICAANGRSAPTIHTLIAAHRRAQDGRGSGLDIAASLRGGLLTYRLHDAQPQVSPATWPSGLTWCCVWSGKSASTGTFLAQLAAWRAQAPSNYGAVMRDLADAASSAAAANSATSLLDAVAAYALALDRLAAASALDIVCAEHRALATLAKRHDVVYKTCGAGGGDIGIALSTDSVRLHAFSQAATQAGFSVLDLQPAAAASVNGH